MPDNLIDIEGIGPAHAATLAGAGLKTTDDLLREAGSADGRVKLAGATGLSEGQILVWVNQADLMRVGGVGSEYADLLLAAGVASVQELATRIPSDLQARMAEVNEGKSLVRRVPSQSEVERWVNEAQSLRAPSGDGARPPWWKFWAR
jgi:predicted flap endonuclease-1-like 5' DNA nuclease